MKGLILLSTAALSLVAAGCASSGGSAGNANGGTTMFSKPTVYSADEFSKSSKSYAKDWVAYKGGGVDSFKKVTFPSYTLEVTRKMFDVNRSKMGVFLKGDGTKNELTLNVNLPVEDHEALMKEIANTSYNRLKEKFKKSGVEVVEWATFKASNKEAQEFEAEKMKNEPITATDTAVTYSADGLSRVSGIWVYGASSLSRSAEISLIMPNFGIGYGYFDGQATPYTIKEAHGMAEIQFTPQVQVLTGSGFAYQSKWNTGVVALDKTMVANEPFVKKMAKQGDSRASATASGEKSRGVYMAFTGAQAHETQVSTSAGINYDLVLDTDKFKAAVLAQLDKAEDLVVERYKNEF